MRIYHLSCGSGRPRLTRVPLINYCLLVETNQGLVLVDTGFGRQDYTHPSRTMRVFAWLMGVSPNVEEAAVCQVERLGFDPADVQHIVLTHLHIDHTGGLGDFPAAKVHVLRGEYEAAAQPRGIVERFYHAAHWAHGPKWVFHDAAEGTVEWYGFQVIRVVPGLSPDVLLIPLPGHTRGHCGVAIETPEGWLFDCSDAASPFHQASDLHGQADPAQQMNWLPAWLAKRVIGAHVPRLRALVREHAGEVQVISGHDVYSFRRWT
jgi:glyoxylase-like metal-dependent hydrolase (beta-lactamase superfamily II)